MLADQKCGHTAPQRATTMFSKASRLSVTIQTMRRFTARKELRERYRIVTSQGTSHELSREGHRCL